MSSRILRFPDVRGRTGLSRPTTWRLERAGKFPARVQLGGGGGAVGWFEHEIEEFLASRPRVIRPPRPEPRQLARVTEEVSASEKRPRPPTRGPRDLPLGALRSAEESMGEEK
ncbi:MAG: helix-turn-helix transcriptional regulator [Burkholderiales bacterium]